MREKIPPGWKNKQAIAAIKRSQAIMKKHGIDINRDFRNFTWARNGGGAHTQKAAIYINKILSQADITGGKAGVEKALDMLGARMRKGQFF